MSRTAKLKARLQAANRRRKKRGSVTGATSVSADDAAGPSARNRESETPDIDVAEILIAASLHAVDRHPNVRDAAVYGALKCLADEMEPKHETTARVLEVIHQCLRKAGVDAPAAERGAKDVCEIARGNLDPNRPDQLIQYFSLISN